MRIRPQRTPDEPVAGLIDDPPDGEDGRRGWRTFDCEPDPAGCRVEFDDPEFISGGRDVLYYVRAIQEPTLAVNAKNVRCEDAECTQLEPCYGDYNTSFDDDCLAPLFERAWSSPIFLDQPGG